MISECCVQGCSSKRSEVPHHTFPKNPEKFRLWKTLIYSKKIEGLSDEEIHKRTICYKHFKDNDYIMSYKMRRLKVDAVPSVALEEGKGDAAASTSAVEVEADAVPSVALAEGEGDAAASTSAVEVELSGNDLSINRRSTRSKSIVRASKRPRMCLLRDNMNRGNLTPRKAKLYKTARLLCRRQAHSKKKCETLKQRLRSAEKLYTSKSLDSLITNLSPAQQAFIHLQLKSSKHAPKGRRYTTEDKILCLSIYKQSRKAYKYLQLLFNLPSGKILRRLLRTMVLQPGLNKNMMDHLAEKAKSMSRLDKICCLMWDEVSIQPHIDFSPVLQRIVGFEDHGKMRRPKFADVALVFMLRGIKTGWKLPLAFYFSDSQMTSTALKSCIKEITETVVNSGLRIAAYVCDQGSSNLKAIRDLVSETASDAPPNFKLSGNIIHLHGQSIVAVYDAPHLIKGVRNNLLTKDLEIAKTATDEKEYLSWNIIELAYEIDNVQPIYRQMRKITDQHIKRHKIKKMRVKYAAQVLSQTMALYIYHHTLLEGSIQSIRGPLSMPVAEGQAAAKYIKFFNNLFDSCNGHTIRSESRYRVAVSKSSPHMRFWSTAITQLEQMRFIHPENKQRKERSTVLKNWITTIKGFQSLSIILQGEGFKHWFPRNINQDPLENFFGCIKSLGFRDTKPTAIQFINHFKTLLINNITTRPSSDCNCESKSTGNVLFDLRTLLNSTNYPNTMEEGDILCHEPLTSQTYEQSNSEQYCLQILKSLSKIELLRSCTLCAAEITQSNLAVACAQAQATIEQYLKANSHRADIIDILTTMLYINIDFNFSSCNLHEQNIRELFVHASVIISLQNWTQNINHILAGKRSSGASADSIDNVAQNKFEKMLKRSKKNVKL